MAYSDADERRRQRVLEGFAREDETIINGEIGDLLSTHGGRKFLWWLLEIGNLGRNPFAANALAMSFNCGELNTSQKILARILEVDAAGYALMIKENADEHQRRDTVLAGGEDPGDGADE